MRILQVTTISNTVNAFLVPHIKHLIAKGNKVDVACNIAIELSPELSEIDCEIFDIPFQRTPFSLSNFTAAKKLKNIMRQRNYDLVHFHTPVASAFGRFFVMGFRDMGLKVLYTAHGFHFYEGAPRINWLTYYSVEKYLSRHTDGLITINNEDCKLAEEKFDACNTFKINGIGLDTKEFSEKKVDKSIKRKTLNISDNDFMILGVGELSKNKNYELVIKAMTSVNKRAYIFIAGDGPLKTKYEKLINELGLNDRVKLLGIRKDIYELCKVSDMFVAPSKREGLGMAVLEAMAAGVPVIASNTRGHKELIENERTGDLVDGGDSEIWAEKINKLIDSPETRKQYIIEGKKKASQFDIGISISQMDEIYARVFK